MLLYIVIFIVIGVAGVVGFKLIRKLMPAKTDDKYDYE